MPARTTLHVEPHVGQRLSALARARGVTPSHLVAELVLEAETTQLVAEVDAELERLAQPADQRTTRAGMARLEAAVEAWTGE